MLGFPMPLLKYNAEHKAKLQVQGIFYLLIEQHLFSSHKTFSTFTVGSKHRIIREIVGKITMFT